MVEGKFGPRHQVRLIWQTELAMPDGRPYIVDQRYTLTLDERSNLRRDLEAWRGKPFSLAEAAGFDLERLIGIPCGLLVVHKPGRDPSKVFANIQAILPAAQCPGKQLYIRDYVRVIHRKAEAAAVTPPPLGPSYAPPVAMPAPIAVPVGVDPFAAGPAFVDSEEPPF